MYVARASSKELVIDPKEVQEARWFNIEALMNAWSHFYNEWIHDDDADAARGLPWNIDVGNDTRVGVVELRCIEKHWGAAVGYRPVQKIQGPGGMRLH